MISLKVVPLLFWLYLKTTDVRVKLLKIKPLIKIDIPKPSANSTTKWVKDKKYRFFVIKKSSKQKVG